MATKTQLQGQEIQEFPLSQLLLDSTNPRFAGEKANASQEDVLDYIAEVIGVRDLLSSMSEGGYHRSFPLVGVREDGKVTVVEGNRRLAAALILTGEARAAGQRTRASNYRLSPKHRKSLETLPVLLAKNRPEVLPYLGIAHIVGSKKWDSFAKAAWAADILDQGVSQDLRDIKAQIGDTHNTLDRMVEAYRMVKQLEGAGLFGVNDTFRSGRGTAPFPFSWIYTALGYNSIRQWIGIGSEDQQRTIAHDPIPPSYLDSAAELLHWMFGSKSRGVQPALSDSRQIPDLAAAVADRKKLALLRRGRSLEEVRLEARDMIDRIADGLFAAQEALKAVLGILGTSAPEIGSREAAFLTTEARRVRNAAMQAYDQLSTIVESKSSGSDQ